VPSGRTNNYPESGRGLGHVTLAIFGSTVGYPSDSLASCKFGECCQIQERLIRVIYSGCHETPQSTLKYMLGF